MRYFEYFSESKIEMLFQQTLPFRAGDFDFSFEVNLGFAKFGIGRKPRSSYSTAEKVDFVERLLRAEGMVEGVDGGGKFFMYSGELLFKRPNIQPDLMLVRPPSFLDDRATFLAFCSTRNFSEAGMYKGNDSVSFSFSSSVYRAFAKGVEDEHSNFREAEKVKDISDKSPVRIFVGRPQNSFLKDDDHTRTQDPTWFQIYSDAAFGYCESRRVSGCFRRVDGPMTLPEYGYNKDDQPVAIYLATPLWIESIS